MTAQCWRNSSKPTVSSWHLWSKTARQHRLACNSYQTCSQTVNTIFRAFRPTFYVVVSLQEAYGSVVEYFGENPKTTQPSMFFPLFGRFIKAYKVRMCGRFLVFITFVALHCMLILVPLNEHRQHSKRLGTRRKWSMRAVRKKSHHLRTRLGHTRYDIKGSVFRNYLSACHLIGTVFSEILDTT